MAIGFSALALAMAAMAVAVVIDGGFLLYSLAHMVAAGCFLWVARDLIDSASLVGRHRLPHLSVLALFLAAVLLRFSCPPAIAAQVGSVPLLSVGIVTLGAALVILAVDDRRPDPLVAVTGRLVLISGGAIAGAAQIIRMFHGFDEYPLYALGLGGSGGLLGAMALFEWRLLSRALALARRGHGKA